MKIKVCVVQSTIDFLNALDDHGRKESDPKRRKALDTLAKRIGDARRKYEAEVRK